MLNAEFALVSRGLCPCLAPLCYRPFLQPAVVGGIDAFHFGGAPIRMGHFPPDIRGMFCVLGADEVGILEKVGEVLLTDRDSVEGIQFVEEVFQEIYVGVVDNC